MANKAIDKHYLLETLKDFYARILLLFFQKKLTVTTVPSDPENNDVIIYVGTTSGNFICGHIYKYNSSSSAWTDLTATGATSWGNINGNISAQSDLQIALDNKYDINDSAGSAGLGDYVPSLIGGSTWESVTWTDFINTSMGNNIWTDGTNIYYSSNTQQYKLNNTTWESITWGGFNEVSGYNIWTDGTNIYYSNETDQYKLNGTTWEAITWNGLTPIDGLNIWTDGTNIYYSYRTTQYKLNGTTWEPMTWTGLTDFYGSCIWTNGVDTFYSNGYAQYRLNGTIWESMTWSGLDNFIGYDIWKDGATIYHSIGTSHHKLNGTTWEPITWSGFTDFRGNYIWNDGINVYYSYYSNQYALYKIPKNVPLSTIKDTICDKYTPLVTQSNGVVVFDNLNPNYGYELQFNNISNATSNAIPKWTNIKREDGTTTGTMKLTYTISGGTNGSSQFALRIEK